MNDGREAGAPCLHAQKVLHGFHVANMGKVRLATTEARRLLSLIYI